MSRTAKLANSGGPFLDPVQEGIQDGLQILKQRIRAAAPVTDVQQRRRYQRTSSMSAYLFLLTGCHERFLVEVEASSLTDLARELSCNRFVVGRLMAVDGAATSSEVAISVSRIGLVVEPE